MVVYLFAPPPPPSPGCMVYKSPNGYGQVCGIAWSPGRSIMMMIAEWSIAIGTLVLAGVAIFQDTVRGWFYHPTFEASIQTRPPDCTAVPYASLDGTKVADSIYLRLWVKNIGNATAKNAEVYASELRRRRTDKTWERVDEFPPMT